MAMVCSRIQTSRKNDQERQKSRNLPDTLQQTKLRTVKVGSFNREIANQGGPSGKRQGNGSRHEQQQHLRCPKPFDQVIHHRAKRKRPGWIPKPGRTRNIAGYFAILAIGLFSCRLTVDQLDVGHRGIVTGAKSALENSQVATGGDP